MRKLGEGVSFGDGELAAGIAEACGDGRILLVTGERLFEASGAAEILASSLGVSRWSRFSDYSPNPTVESFGRLHFRVRSLGLENFTSILAVGGGTSIDLAKLVKAFGRNEKFSSANLSKPVAQPWDIPLVAVPTTAGSGSEATHFSVIYDGHTKYSVADDRLRPQRVFIEPQLLSSLSPKEAAAGGLDALCQGIESYWARAANDESRRFAVEAISLAWQHLEAFVRDRCPEAMKAMALASYLSGCAIDRSKTTAAHAISYPLTSRFNVRHGHAVALAMTVIFPFNAGSGSMAVQQTIAEIAALLGLSSGEVAGSLSSLVRRLGLEGRLDELGVKTESDLEFILNHGFNPQRVKNNPVELDRRSLAKLLRPLMSLPTSESD